jgi:hypothetical protein
VIHLGSALGEAKRSKGTKAKISFKSYDSPVEALEDVLKEKPKIIGIGEYHQNQENSKIPSSMQRFTNEMLPVLKDKVSDLLLETWIVDKKCGEVEEKAVTQMDQTLDKPETTEDELVSLVKTSRKLGITPHILKFSCQDYQSFYVDNEIQFGTLLELITERLKSKATTIFEKKDPASDKMIMLYGGLIHNTLYPPDPYERKYSYALSLKELTHDHYIELDMIVPEYVEKDPAITRQSWFKTYKKKGSSRQTFLINPRPFYYVMVLPRTTP